MRTLFLCLVLLSLPPMLLASAGPKQKAPDVQIRLQAEAKEHEGPSFVVPIDLAFPKKRIFIRKVPIVSERNIAAIFPFSSEDGSLGCTFRLDPDGSQKLEEHTTGARDTIVVALINGRVAAAMTTNKRITDGIFTIPKGFLPGEILVLQSQFPTIGKEKEFESQKKEALASLHKQAKAQIRAESKAKAKAMTKPTPAPKHE